MNLIAAFSLLAMPAFASPEIAEVTCRCETNTLANHDMMTRYGALSAGFINKGIVPDHSKVRLNSFGKSENTFTVHISGFSGHDYRLQRADELA